MSIFITGDIHGYPIRLTDEKLNLSGVTLTKGDKLIICGDFGLPWYNDEEDLKCLAWLSERPFEILFIDGNHENFDLLNSFPVEKRYGGKVHRICDNVYHLMRGEVYRIDGRTFFTFGGATSSDRHMREAHISWWEEEIYGREESLKAIRNLIRAGYKVDYVITHTAPERFSSHLDVHSQGVEACPVARLLSDLSGKIECKKWYFGHFHVDVDINDAATCVYERIIKIDD